jgi:Cleft lip and palate transmembrane protein 1 (CLPTM1)
VLNHLFDSAQPQVDKDAQPNVAAPNPASFEQQQAVATDYFPILPNGVFYNPTPAHVSIADLPETFLPLWSAGLDMDLTVYTSENAYFTDYNAKPIWTAEKISWGDYDDKREQSVQIPATKVS